MPIASAAISVLFHASWGAIRYTVHAKMDIIKIILKQSVRVLLYARLPSSCLATV